MEYKLYDFDPYNLPDDILQRIGLIIACSTQTENLVEGAIQDLLSLQTVAAKILTTHMSMQVRLGVLRSAAEMQWRDDPATLSEFETVLQRIDAAIGERNRIAHVTWQRDPEDDTVFTSKIRARKALKVDLEPVTAQALDAIALEVYSAGLALMQFMGVRGIRQRQS